MFKWWREAWVVKDEDVVLAYEPRAATRGVWVYPEWPFSQVVPMGPIGAPRKEIDMMLVDVIADRIVNAEKELKDLKGELRQYKLEHYYPSFKQFSISQSLHALTCDECGEGVTVVEKDGRSVVACTRCGVSVEATSTWLHYILQRNKRASFPINK